MADKNKVYACCPNCSNDYYLQIIGSTNNDIKYLCAECYTEFKVKKDSSTTT